MPCSQLLYFFYFLPLSSEKVLPPTYWFSLRHHMLEYISLTDLLAFKMQNHYTYFYKTIIRCFSGKHLFFSFCTNLTACLLPKSCFSGLFLHVTFTSLFIYHPILLMWLFYSPSLLSKYHPILLMWLFYNLVLKV